MKKSKVETWVIYRMTMYKKQFSTNSICTQSEWEQMERQSPGYHKLLQSGISCESEAEKLARGTSGDPLPRTGLEPRA
jgi:hypothetical protein